jgi:hypothetical protein
VLANTVSEMAMIANLNRTQPSEGSSSAAINSRYFFGIQVKPCQGLGCCAFCQEYRRFRI